MVFKINGICKKCFFFISDLVVLESIILVLLVIWEFRCFFIKIFYCKYDCDNFLIFCRFKLVLVDFGLKFVSFCVFCFLKYMFCVFIFLKKLF